MKHEQITELTLLIFKCNGELIKVGDELVRDFSLTSAKWQILGPISKSSDGLTAPQIAQAMGLSRQAVQKQLNVLMTDNLILQVNNPKHLRSVKYQLTSLGEKAIGLANKKWILFSEALGLKFTKTEIEKMIGLVKNFTHVLANSKELK